MCCLIEPLEPRQLLSSSLSATFVGRVPASVLPVGGNHAAIRVSNGAGSGSAESVRVSLFASPEPGLGGGAIALQTPAHTANVKAGRSATVRFAFASPSTIAGGSYYLVARVDPVGPRTGDESVTVAASKPTAFVQPTVDLSAQIVQQPSMAVHVGTASPGGGQVTVAILNAGGAPAAGALSISVYASTDNTFRAQGPVIGQRAVPRFTLKAGRWKAYPVPIVIPAGTPAGSYHLFASVNLAGVTESNLANNVATTLTLLRVTNAGPYPDSGGHGHHGGYAGYGYGIDYGYGVIGVGIAGTEAVDGAAPVEDYPPPADAGAPEPPPDNSGYPPSEPPPSGAGDSSTQPTTEPTTQPDGGGDTGSYSADTGSSAGDSAGSTSDFGSGGSFGGDFGSGSDSSSGGDFGSGSNGYDSMNFESLSRRKVTRSRGS